VAGPAALQRWAARALPGARPCERSTPVLAAAHEQLGEYAAGRRRAFDLPLDLRGTLFQRAVWVQLGLIPYGRTRTYGDLAARLGRPGAARAVGLAAGRNPLPVLVPCHRLVADDGLGGFSAGRERKRRLLAVEGVRFPAQGTLDLGSSRPPRPRG
jgi:methylated-DNA-[protein]-cysteine S-methyltransferase